MWRSVAIRWGQGGWATHNDRNQTWLHTCCFLLSHWRPSSWIGPFVTKYSPNGGQDKVHTICLYECVFTDGLSVLCGLTEEWGENRLKMMGLFDAGLWRTVLEPEVTISGQEGGNRVEWGMDLMRNPEKIATSQSQGSQSIPCFIVYFALNGTTTKWASTFFLIILHTIFNHL